MADPFSPDAQIEALVDERDMRSIYANFFRMFTASEELVLEFCFNMPNPNPAAAGKQQVLIKVSDRVIMSYSTAKRLANSLTQLVKRYEQQYGEIPGARK
jgi:thermostable 8-oxoguanine DNA glycosylase